MNDFRVLVFSATFGAGHLRAADALIEVFHEKLPDAEVTHLDCGEILSKTFNTILKNTYLGMIRHSPRLWGRVYYGMAKISPDSMLQSWLNSLGRSEFEKIISLVQPHLIVCTYPTVAGVMSQLRLKGKLRVPVVTVVTDYVVHNQWIHQGVDMYIVGCNQVADGMAARGIDPRRIRVTGIPVSSGFERHLNKTEIITKLGLRHDRQTLLVMGGAYGVLDSLKEMCGFFAGVDWPVQSIVVCGRDQKLYRSLEDIAAGARNPLVRFGFVNNVEELMSAADLIITKAGGLTVSEALTKRLPLVIFRPIPGQEYENTVFLSKIGAGKYAESQEQLAHIVQSLLEQPRELAKMSQAAARTIPGDAAERAVEHMLSLVGEVLNEEKIG